MSQSHLLCYVIASALFGSGSSGTLAATPHSLDHIEQALETRAELFLDVGSFYVECEYRNVDHLYYDDAQEAELVRLLKDGDFSGIPERLPTTSRVSLIPGYSFRLARRGSRYYSRIVNPLDAKYGPAGLEASFDGAAGVEIQQTHHAIITPEPSAYCWQKWVYTELLHLNIYKHVEGLDYKARMPPAVRVVCLPEDIDDARGTYELRGLQTVDDAQCVILARPGVVTFWLDPELAFAPRRVELFWNRDGVPRELLKSVRTMAEFREERPGLWLPRLITEDLYASPELDRPSEWGKPAVRYNLAVTDMEFDSLSDDFFEITIPQGVIIHDAFRNLKYVNHASGEPFGKALEFARTRAEPPNTRLTVLALGTLVVALIAALLFARSRQRT